MATWFLSYDRGSDNNSGDSFAVTLTGADFVSAGTTTMTKASGGLTGLAGRKIYIVGIGGRHINSVESDISMTLNASVAANTYTANVGGRRSNITNMTTTNCQALAAGDTFKEEASPAPTALGVNVTWTNLSATLTLASALTADVYSDGAWTSDGGANVVCATSSTRKEGSNSASMAIGAGFTTGLAAHFATGTLDLSAYKQLSFAIQQTVGTLIGASAMRLCLCSDTAGTAIVDTFVIPALTGGALSVWNYFTVDKGSALGSAIASIALYVDTDVGAQTILLDNIIAVKDATAADCLSLTSLIGKPNSSGAGGTNAETWYGIKSIRTTTVILDSGRGSNVVGSTNKGFSGATETVAGWKRETTKTALTSSTTDAQSVALSGTSGNLITISGGWNRTDMSTQTDETWFDGQNGGGDGIAASARNFISISKCNFTAYFNGTNNWDGTDCIFTDMTCCNCDGSGFSRHDGVRHLMTNVKGYNNNSAGFVSFLANNQFIGNVVTARNNVGIGFSSWSGDAYIATLIAINNGSAGLSSMTSGGSIMTITTYNNAGGGNASPTWSNCKIYIDSANNTGNGMTTLIGANNFIQMISSGNTTAGYTHGASQAPVYFTNSLMIDTTPIAAIGAGFNFREFKIGVTNFGMDPNDNRLFMDGGQAISQTGIRHTDADIAWQLNPTSTNRSTIYPLCLSLGAYAFESGARSASLWCRRTHTDLTVGIRIKSRQLHGVDTDVSGFMTAAANTWEQVSINFSPTKRGVAELEAFAYGGIVHSGFVDDLSIN